VVIDNNKKAQTRGYLTFGWCSFEYADATTRAAKDAFLQLNRLAAKTRIEGIFHKRISVQLTRPGMKIHSFVSGIAKCHYQNCTRAAPML
jgi:hypothetical protein